MSQIKVGIVGAGRIAHLHAKGYLNNPDAKIVAVCDTDEDAAIKTALAWGTTHYYTDFHQLLASPDIDAVDITTPNYLHGPQALNAIAAGKHVCVENPITTRYEQISSLRQAAGGDKILQVFEPLLFYKPLIDARAMIDAGEIGETIGLQITATLGTSTLGSWSLDPEALVDRWRFNETFSGGSALLYDIVYPAFCIALFLVGPIDSLHGWTMPTELGNDFLLDAPASAMWRHLTDIPCFGQLAIHHAPDQLIQTSYLPITFNVKVHGAKGYIKVTRTPDPMHPDATLVVSTNHKEVIFGQSDDAYEESYFKAVDNFVDACQGKAPPTLGVSEAEQLVVLCLAYLESNRQQTTITLHQP